MKKNLFYLQVGILFLLSACSDNFLDIEPKDSITDEAVWKSASSTKLYVNEVYNQVLTGTLYNFVGGYDYYTFDHLFTDDATTSLNALNEYAFTASTYAYSGTGSYSLGRVLNRWWIIYSNIYKANLGIERIAVSEVLSDDEKDRFLGDLHFLRALSYLELWRYYGGVPIIKKPLNRQEDEIYYGRSSEEDVIGFIVSDFDLAATKLPITLKDDEYGRATKGAALGMKAVALLHAGGTIKAAYYQDAADAAEVFITGELKDVYKLFGENANTDDEKKQAFINLFLEEYEGNEEVIFDVQYNYPYRLPGGFQTIAAPGAPGKDNAYGWGRSHPTQNLVDAFEMKDGSLFDWNNSSHVDNPFVNRDNRFYGTVLYDGMVWKEQILSLSSNRFDNKGGSWIEETNNLPNGLFSTKAERTRTGYFLRKHMNEPVICGHDNRANGIGDGANLIVLRLAEILLTYAEAKNELSGPETSVYSAINLIRRRAGQPDLPMGLSQSEMRERIRNERRVELAFENKRYFDIMRWRKGDVYLNQPIYGMNVKYVLENNTPKATYQRFIYINKVFDVHRCYLFPIPQVVIDRNPKLVGHQNPGW